MPIRNSKSSRRRTRQLIFIDQQPQMAFGVQSIDRQALKNNVVALAKAAKVFNIPTTITTVETESFSGNTYPELLAVFPDKPDPRAHLDELVGRPERARRAGKANGRKKSWSRACGPRCATTRSRSSAMLEGGYEIYMVADASGGTSKEAHDYAMQRMIQAGVVPVTWQQVLLEWQRDWARKDTYDAVMAIVQEHSGAYGMGVDYAYTMVHKAPQRTRRPMTLAPVRGITRRHAGWPMMRTYLLSLGAGLLVGVVYSLLNVRSPAPPVVALIGLLGILLGEQIIPVAKHDRWTARSRRRVAQTQCGPHVFGVLPGRHERPLRHASTPNGGAT